MTPSRFWQWLRRTAGPDRGPQGSAPAHAPTEEHPPEPSPPRLDVGMASDPGTVRSLNEDCVAHLHLEVAQDERREVALLVLADGMGGHAAGETASRVAVAAALQALAPAALVPLALPEASEERAGETLREVLEGAVEQADRAVREQTPEGGTTLLLALVAGDQLYLAHVGDSRAYLIREGRAEQLTRDHSLVGRLVELGELSPEQARSHPQRSLLYRTLGQGSRLEVDFLSRSLGASGTLLLCTDGLWSLFSEAELAAHIGAASNAQAACEALVAEARRRGADDNVSLLVARSLPLATEETA